VTVPYTGQARKTLRKLAAIKEEPSAEQAKVSKLEQQLMALKALKIDMVRHISNTRRTLGEMIVRAPGSEGTWW
jgi:uncharacterized protein (DUF342 family)